MDIINKTKISKYMSVHVRYRVTWHANTALAEGGSGAVGARGELEAGAEGEREAEAEAGGVPLTCSAWGKVWLPRLGCLL